MITKKIGDQAEEKAKNYLISKGFVVLEANYRFRRAEVDLIVQRDQMIVFVEVKYRANSRFGHPESFVDDKKAEMVGMAATHYCEKQGWLGRIRFDIIAITGSEIEHFEDAFN